MIQLHDEAERVTIHLVHSLRMALDLVREGSCEPKPHTLVLRAMNVQQYIDAARSHRQMFTTHERTTRARTLTDAVELACVAALERELQRCLNDELERGVRAGISGEGVAPELAAAPHSKPKKKKPRASRAKESST